MGRFRKKISKKILLKRDNERKQETARRLIQKQRRSRITQAYVNAINRRYIRENVNVCKLLNISTEETTMVETNKSSLPSTLYP